MTPTSFKPSSLKVAILGVLGSMALTSCNFPFSASTLDLANALTHKLNVPVFVWADPNSYCVNKQVQEFVDDYNASDSDTQAKIEEYAKSFRSIVIEEAVAGPTLVGERIELRLMQHNFWTWLGTSSEEIDRVLIVDKRRPLTGRDWPGTQLVAEKDLTISPVYSEDKTVLKLFSTEDRETYENARSAEDLDAKMKTGIVSATEAKAEGLNCGKLIKLSLVATKKK